MNARPKSSVVLLTLLATHLGRNPIKPPPEMRMTTPEIIAYHGYPAEDHTVITSDGYILEMHRIPGGLGGRPPNPALYPIIIAHSYCTSSNNFVMMGPQKGLAFLAAEAGYDVWMINTRFTQYSSHVNVSRDDPAYWDFGFDEMLLIDTPESLDYILKVTGAEKYHYVGVSLGCVSYMILCNYREDLAKRVASYTALSPSYVMANLKKFSKYFLRAGYLDMLMKNNVKVIGGDVKTNEFLATVFCPAKEKSDDVCWSLIFKVFGEHYENVAWEYIPIIFYKTQPISVQSFKHLLQASAAGELMMYDYGEKENLLRYGTPKPPKYKVTANYAPVSLYYGVNDIVFAKEEQIILKKIYKASNVTVKITKFKGKYNHLDSVYGKNSHELYKMALERINFLNITKSSTSN